MQYRYQLSRPNTTRTVRGLSRILDSNLKKQSQPTTLLPQNIYMSFLVK